MANGMCSAFQHFYNNNVFTNSFNFVNGLSFIKVASVVSNASDRAGQDAASAAAGCFVMFMLSLDGWGFF
jgi:hypothetical protein